MNLWWDKILRGRGALGGIFTSWGGWDEQIFGW